MGESADRIHKAAKGAPEEQSIVFLAHNGPTGSQTVTLTELSDMCLKMYLIFLSNFWISDWAGLGSSMDDICGKDWEYGGGDHGDPGNLIRVVILLPGFGFFICTLLHRQLLYCLLS